MEQEVCRLKHESIDMQLQDAKNRLNNHGERLDRLEVGQAEINTQVKLMCEKLEKLTDAIYDVLKSVVGVAILTGIGFIIWYIQKL